MNETNNIQQIPIYEWTKLIEKIKIVLNGNLNVTFDNKNGGKLSELERTLDDWLANNQEVLLFTAAAIIDIKKEIQSINKNNDIAEIEVISKKIIQLEKMIKEFKFYHIEFSSDNIKGTEIREAF